MIDPELEQRWNGCVRASRKELTAGIFESIAKAAVEIRETNWLSFLVRFEEIHHNGVGFPHEDERKELANLLKTLPNNLRAHLQKKAFEQEWAREALTMVDSFTQSERA